MSGAVSSVIPSSFAVALALAVAGCAQVSQAPDSDYRQALENALVTGRCDGTAIDRMWSAYGRWYAIASSIAGHRMADEAESLMRQGQQFQTIGCPAVARASYRTVLQRFPQDDFAALRENARAALQTLPPSVASAPPAASAGPRPTGSAAESPVLPTLIRPSSSAI
ncbi:hypothetical protein [Azospirillum sp. TSO35-2]|uniref:hypothetical protein n=1 Tax=Azospirillum sp. TSO35-2 TaxID=716796 RepID=UPI0011B830DC|nr:hypothetical protein [Azospirillum sp. TSO35-2]